MRTNRIIKILMICVSLSVFGCGVLNAPMQHDDYNNSNAKSEIREKAEVTKPADDIGHGKEAVPEYKLEPINGDSESWGKKIYVKSDELQGNILGYSLIRIPPNPENMYYEQDMSYLVEEEFVGKGIYISDYMCETEVFLGDILKGVLTHRGTVSEENRKYFTDYALRQLEGTDWELLDDEWELIPFAYDREYSVNPLLGGGGYYFQYSFYPDQVKVVKEETNKTDCTLYVDNDGRICEIKISFSTVPTAESRMEQWINTKGLFDNAYCEQIIRDGHPCREKLIWDFERHFRKFMMPEEVYEQENTGLLESGNVCVSAQTLADIFSYIIEKRGADVEKYKEYFGYDENYEELADTEWGVLGETWIENEGYDCFFVDRISLSGYAGFRYYFYPDFEIMDVDAAQVVVIDCNINIYNGMIDYNNIDIFPLTVEAYQAIKSDQNKNKALVVEQGKVLSGEIGIAIPVMDRQVKHVPISELNPGVLDTLSGKRKVKGDLWGFTDTAEAADYLGKKFLKDLDEGNLETGEIFQLADDKETMHSVLYEIGSFIESDWKADRRFDCFWVQFHEAAGYMHLQYYFYPERTREEQMSGRTLVVDMYVSEDGIASMEINELRVEFTDIRTERET